MDKHFILDYFVMYVFHGWSPSLVQVSVCVCVIYILLSYHKILGCISHFFLLQLSSTCKKWMFFFLSLFCLLQPYTNFHGFVWVVISIQLLGTTLYESNYVFSYPSGLIMLEQKTMVLHLLILCHLIVRMKCSYLWRNQLIQLWVPYKFVFKKDTVLD